MKPTGPSTTCWPDAAGFAARLGALASALPTPEPLALHPPEHEPLAPVNGFRPPAVSELTQVPPSVTKSGAKPAPVGTKAGPGEIFDAEPGSARARAEADGSDGASGANGLVIAVRRKSRKKMFWIIGVLVLVLALAAAAVVAVHDKVFTPSHPVPILAGLPLEKARAAATKDHFTLHVENGEKSITVGNGVIIRQSPKAGKVLKQGATLSVVPSIGPPAVAVPSLTGMNCTQAAAALVTAHLKGLCIAGQFSDTVTNGLVISWSYDGAQNPQSAAYGSTIQIIPSLGHGPVPVPTSISQTDTYQDALVLLQAAGLNGTEAYAPNISGVPPGDVISLYPPSGTSVPYGSTVKVTISTGPPTTTVSNVLGDTVPQATTTLQDDGLTVSGVQGNPTGTVIGTNPPTGTTVQTGSSVQILAQ
jgi:eukaryotic-like serine/threonine-protein kinase